MHDPKNPNNNGIPEILTYWFGFPKAFCQLFPLNQFKSVTKHNFTIFQKHQ